jgi:hypothetical protein
MHAMFGLTGRIVRSRGLLFRALGVVSVGVHRIVN